MGHSAMRQVTAAGVETKARPIVSAFAAGSHVAVFSTLTELSIALAGFAGIVIAISAAEGPVAPLTWFRNLCALVWSLAVAFSSVVPEIFEVSGAKPTEVWINSSLVVGTSSLALMLFALLAARWLSQEERKRLSLGVWALCLGGNSAVALLQITNATGLLGSPGPAPAALGLLWLLAFAAFLFVRMLARHPSTPAE